MKPLWLNQKSMMLHLGGVAVLVAMTLACWFAAVIPASEHQKQAIELSRRLQTRQSELDRQLRLRQRLEAQLAATRAELATSNLQLLPGGKLNERLAVVADLAGRCQLRIDSIDPDGTLSGQLIQVRPLKLRGHGSFASAFGFMRDLPVELPDMSVSGFQISAERNAEGIGATFTMTLNWCAQSGTEKTASVQH